MLFQERIQKFEYRLNPTEDDIIEFIVENQELVMNASIQSLAKNCFTAPTTIMRLVKKLGYGGFSDFKLALRREQEIRQQNQLDPFAHNLLKTSELIDANLFSQIAHSIQKAKRVFFYGVGDNSYLCLLAANDLRVAHPNVVAVNYRHELLYLLESATETDVFFFLSFSGETTEIINLAQNAKKRTALIVSITHFQPNSLATIADFSLYCFSPTKHVSSYNVTDKTPAQFILRAFSEYFWQFCQLESR